MELLKDMTLEDSVTALHKMKFTGKLGVRAKSGSSWNLYFGFGDLIWIGGGPHPNRSSLRNFRRSCKDTDLRSVEIPDAESFECSDYFILTTLLQSKKLNLEQLRAFIVNKITEDLFDILRQENVEQVLYESNEKSVSFLLEIGLRASIVSIDIEAILKKAQMLWSAWQEQGFSSLSPNAAPRLEQKEKLKQAVSEGAYQNLVTLVDGNRTLYDLAAQMNLGIGRLTASLAPYMRGGYVKLFEVPDLQDSIFFSAPVLRPQREANRPPAQGARRPLIGCIDDSAQVCKIMQLVLSNAGYDFIAVQDSLTTVSTFIERTPDLIFLDLNMPIVNGYEVCSQLRRVAKLKDIPIVILTGNDGIVDRVRSKVVGASGFMTKPIDQGKVISIVRKMLSDRLEADNSGNVSGKLSPT